MYKYIYNNKQVIVHALVWTIVGLPRDAPAFLTASQ